MIRSIIRTVLIILVFLFLVFLLWRFVSGTPFPGAQSNVPLDVKSIVPKSWTVLTDKGVVCDFDEDGAAEWLVMFRYDTSGYGPQDSLTHGEIGGVVYDSQVNRVPQSPGAQSPSRPALLIPYPLLPDVYAGKGQGYLGEADVRTHLYQLAGSKTCSSSEFAVLGTTSGTLPGAQAAFLSLFRWDGDAVGYSGVHYVGNARIAIDDPAKPIVHFQTYNRLNDRSVLCAVQAYSRPVATGEGAVPQTIQFTEDAAAYTIDFCFNAPGDPFYPEGVVVAFLRGRNPSSPDDPTPTGESFLTQDALDALPPELALLASANRLPIPILSVSNPGTLAPGPAEGRPCTAAQAGVNQQAGTPSGVTATPQWWCGRERASVETEILLDGQRRQVHWSLISMASSSTTSGLHWRVDNLELR